MDARRISKWTKIELLFAIPLMLMACSLSSAIPATSTTVIPTDTQGAPTAQATEAPTLTTAPLQPIHLTPTITLPQSFKYADLTFNVTKAEITNQVSDTNPSIDPTNTYARLSIQVVNLTALEVKIPAGHFILKLGDGTKYSQDLIEDGLGKGSDDVSLQYIVPANETWSGAQLSLDEKGTVPGVVKLDGPQATSLYPITLTAGQKLTLKTFRPMTYTVNTAVMELDGLGVRAKIGSHYLVLGINAYCNNSVGCYVGPEEMRLIVDGVPESPETIVPDSSDLNYQGSEDVQAAFVVPDNATKLGFEVGEVGKGTTQTPMPMK